MRKFDENGQLINPSLGLNRWQNMERETEPAEDIVEAEASTWEAAWIDLGGEG